MLPQSRDTVHDRNITHSPEMLEMVLPETPFSGGGFASDFGTQLTFLSEMVFPRRFQFWLSQTDSQDTIYYSRVFCGDVRDGDGFSADGCSGGGFGFGVTTGT